MSKISRKSFEKDKQIITEVSKSHVAFVDLAKKALKCLYQEVDELKAEIKELKSHMHVHKGDLILAPLIEGTPEIEIES